MRGGNNIMEYRGYHTKVEYSAEDEMLYGVIMGIKSTIVFGGKSIDEFKTAFCESVDGYLDLCERRGLSPEKEFRGVFNLRVSPEMHRELVLTAEKQKKSLNATIIDACERFLGETG